MVEGVPITNAEAVGAWPFFKVLSDTDVGT